MEKKIKPKRSKNDGEGRLVVACCECKRGGNGEQSCAAGGQAKRWNRMSCLSGRLLEKYELPDGVTKGNF